MLRVKPCAEFSISPKQTYASSLRKCILLLALAYQAAFHTYYVTVSYALPLFILGVTYTKVFKELSRKEVIYLIAAHTIYNQILWTTAKKC